MATRERFLGWALLALRALILACFVGLPFLIGSPPASADPPPPPPFCNVKHDDVFCFRFTRFRGDVSDSNRWRLEFEVLNWTNKDVHGLVVMLNTGGDHTVIDDPPVIVSAAVDRDGRPLIGPASPPAGNLPTNNDWTVFNQTATRVDFLAGTPIPTADALVGGTTYRGLRDPEFENSTGTDCRDALLMMIPGSVNSGGSGTDLDPYCITIPDRETIDDGVNVLDGFVVEIDELDHAEEMSLNWFMLDENGIPIGFFTFGLVGGGVMGDPLGFGTLNVSLLPPFPGSSAPPPLLTVNSINPTAINTGYDPIDNTDPDVDSASFYAEDTVSSVDTYPLNPIPLGVPGQGAFFTVEPGATVTAPFTNPSDANVGGVQPAVIIDSDPPAACSNYCIAGSNSVSAGGAIISGRGSNSIAANDFVLMAGPVPNQPGIFYYGPSQVTMPFGDGFRCIGGAVWRLPITFASGGIASFAVDYNNLPFPIVAGDTWNFQCWYRDPAAGMSGFNLSDGLTCTFTP